jgi:hypothetical protein
MGRRPEVRDASLMLGRTTRGGNEVRDARLALGRTKRGGNEVRDASLTLGRTDGVERDCDSKGRFSSTAEKVFQQHRIGETGQTRLLLYFYFSNP